MRVEDLYEARRIVDELGKLNTQACALELNIKSAGIRVDDSAASWVELPVSAHRQVVGIAKQHNAVRQAELRRRAAQIGLVLS